MRWKDVLIGALSALAVTIVGGTAVYYLTKEPETKERLVYATRSSGHFAGDTQQVAFTSVEVTNRGGRAASNVIASVQFVHDVIKEASIVAAPGAESTHKDTSQKAVSVAYKKLLPGESITINLLLSRPSEPRVEVRSDESFALRESADDSAKGKVNKATAWLVPISGVLFLMLSTMGYIRVKRMSLPESRLVDMNNAGFLLLHNGLVDEAEQVLEKALKAGRYDSFTLSNLALVKVLKGLPDKASSLLSAARFREKTGHSEAVVSFNEFLISLLNGDKQRALAQLKTAIDNSPKEIRHYCEKSIHLAAFRTDTEITNLLATKP